MDASTKAMIKEDLLAHLRSRASADSVAITDDARAAAFEEDSLSSPDDIATQNEAGEMHALMQQVAARQAADIAAIEELDMSPTDQVRPGAIVTLGGERYIVGSVTDDFTSGGKTYSGMGSESPMFKAIEGLRAGDSFTFRDKKQKVDAVD